MFKPIRSFDMKKMIVFPVSEDKQTFFLHTESGVQELPKTRLKIARYPRADGKHYTFLLDEKLNLTYRQQIAYDVIKAYIHYFNESDPYFKEITTSLGKFGIELFGLL